MLSYSLAGTLPASTLSILDVPGAGAGIRICVTGDPSIAARGTVSAERLIAACRTIAWVSSAMGQAIMAMEISPTRPSARLSANVVCRRCRAAKQATATTVSTGMAAS